MRRPAPRRPTAPAREGDDITVLRAAVDGGLRDADEPGALHRIAGLTVGTDERAAIGAVLRLVSDVVACEHPLLFLHEAGSGRIQVHDLDGNEGAGMPSGSTIVRRILSSGDAEIVNDVLSDRDPDHVLIEGFGARQIVAAPLVTGDGRLGVVAALNSSRGAFADDDVRLLTLVADRAALTIENARLRATTERQAQEVTGLQRLSRLLASAETVEQAVDASAATITELLDCERAAILLHDGARDALVLHTPGSDAKVEGLEVPLAEPSLAGTVFRTDTPLLSNTARDDAWVGDALRDAFGIRSLLVVPLTSGQGPIGVLIAINARRGSFTDGDLGFTSLLGPRIGGVIEVSGARERERALLQRLREADRTKTEFVSMLAHELKGPMTTIKGFGEALRDQWDRMPAAQRSRFLDIVTKEIDRLSRLVNDLLDVSRMEAGTLRYDMEPIDVAETVGAILVVHPSLTAQHIVLDEVPDDLPVALGDKDRIRQVLLNLISNATRYAPEGTTVRIGAEGRGADICVWVADEGIGIAPADLDRVFSKFVMLPKPDWVVKGTGLGLFITKGIVEAHGGRIWVESSPGDGSTFYFTLRRTGA